MRAFVSLLLLSAPMLACAGLAHAAEPGQVGKPVCTHYEGTATKPADTRNKPVSAAAASAASPSATPSSGSGLRPLGGDGSELRPNNAPRWQAFLPGMFR